MGEFHRWRWIDVTEPDVPPRLHRAFFDTMADARNGRPQMLVRLVVECQIAVMESALAARLP